MNNIIYISFVIYLYTSICGFIPSLFLLLIRNSIYALYALLFVYRFSKISMTKEVIHYFFLIIVLIVYSIIISALNQRPYNTVLSLTKQNLFFIFLFFLKDIENNKYKRLLTHLYFAILLQALYTVIAYISIQYLHMSIFKLLPSSDMHIMSSDGFSTHTRIFSRLQPFLLVGVIYNLSLLKRNLKSVVELIVLCYALFISKTLVFYFIIIIAIFSIKLMQKKCIAKKYFFFILCITFFILYLTATFDFTPYGEIGKVSSFYLKQQQILSLTKLNNKDLFFGKGIGYEFYIDNRMTGDMVIEILPVFWLTTVGIIGFSIQLYLLLSLLLKLRSEKNISRELIFITVSQTSLFLTCLSNGYIISGSTAYMMILYYFLNKEAGGGYGKGFDINYYCNKK